MSSALVRWLEENADVSLWCEPEPESPKGYFASGDDAADAEDEAWVFDQLHRGNEWAWCIAAVKVQALGLEETEYLGGCMYQSEKDFRADGLEDMRPRRADRACKRRAEPSARRRNGDPRGYVVAVKVPSGRSDYAGAEGVGVPTPSH